MIVEFLTGLALGVIGWVVLAGALLAASIYLKSELVGLVAMWMIAWPLLVFDYLWTAFQGWKRWHFPTSDFFHKFVRFSVQAFGLATTAEKLGFSRRTVEDWAKGCHPPHPTLQRQILKQLYSRWRKGKWA